jgi:enoyl-CoA hydratase
LTGNFLDADTACRWGLVNRVVSAEDLLPTCQQLARDIVSTEPVTRGEVLRIMNAGWESTLAEGLSIERAATRAHDKSQNPAEQVASRRQQIQDRGRSQND